MNHNLTMNRIADLLRLIEFNIKEREELLADEKKYFKELNELLNKGKKRKRSDEKLKTDVLESPYPVIVEAQMEKKYSIKDSIEEETLSDKVDNDKNKVKPQIIVEEKKKEEEEIVFNNSKYEKEKREKENEEIEEEELEEITLSETEEEEEELEEVTLSEEEEEIDCELLSTQEMKEIVEKITQDQKIMLKKFKKEKQELIGTLLTEVKDEKETINIKDEEEKKVEEKVVKVMIEMKEDEKQNEAKIEKKKEEKQPLKKEEEKKKAPPKISRRKTTSPPIPKRSGRRKPIINSKFQSPCLFQKKQLPIKIISFKKNNIKPKPIKDKSELFSDEKIKIDYGVYNIENSDFLNVNLNIWSKKISNEMIENKRVGNIFIFAIDISSNMAKIIKGEKESKLNVMKEKLLNFIKNLTSIDIFVLITFNDESCVKLGFTSMNKDGKEKAKEAILKLKGSGNSNFLEAVKKIKTVLIGNTDSTKSIIPIIISSSFDLKSEAFKIELDENEFEDIHDQDNCNCNCKSCILRYNRNQNEKRSERIKEIESICKSWKDYNLTFMLGISENHDSFLLSQLAKKTKGFYFKVDLNNINNALSNFFEKISEKILFSNITLQLKCKTIFKSNEFKGERRLFLHRGLRMSHFPNEFEYLSDVVIKVPDIFQNDRKSIPFQIQKVDDDNKRIKIFCTLKYKDNVKNNSINFEFFVDENNSSVGNKYDSMNQFNRLLAADTIGRAANYGLKIGISHSKNIIENTLTQIKEKCNENEYFNDPIYLSIINDFNYLDRYLSLIEKKKIYLLDHSVFMDIANFHYYQFNFSEDYLKKLKLNQKEEEIASLMRIKKIEKKEEKKKRPILPKRKSKNISNTSSFKKIKPKFGDLFNNIKPIQVYNYKTKLQ